jgi:hypothetical protein
MRKAEQLAYLMYGLALHNQGKKARKRLWYKSWLLRRNV